MGYESLCKVQKGDMNCRDLETHSFTDQNLAGTCYISDPDRHPDRMDLNLVAGKVFCFVFFFFFWLVDLPYSP